MPTNAEETQDYGDAAGVWLLFIRHCHRYCFMGKAPVHTVVAQMKDQDFQGIVAGLEDAIAFVRGDTARGRVAAGPDVKAIRAKTKLSQTKS
jgi:hypothetical protein